jgi:hypothetical protein
MGITAERLQQSLAECAAAFANAGVPFAVVGAFALAMHGHVRATRDIDFLVRIVDRDAARGCLEGLGYDCTFQSDAFAHFERRPLPELPGVVERADLRFSAHEVGQRAIEAAMAQPMPWARGVLPVVPLETLLLMKLMAASASPARLQDLVDVRALLGRGTERLDVGRMRETAAWMGPDVLRLLDEELARAAGGVSDVVPGYGERGLGL